jgi:hypothetical protein
MQQTVRGCPQVFMERVEIIIAAGLLFLDKTVQSPQQSFHAAGVYL